MSIFEMIVKFNKLFKLTTDWFILRSIYCEIDHRNLEETLLFVGGIRDLITLNHFQDKPLR